MLHKVSLSPCFAVDLIESRRKALSLHTDLDVSEFIEQGAVSEWDADRWESHIFSAHSTLSKSSLNRINNS